MVFPIPQHALLFSFPYSLSFCFKERFSPASPNSPFGHPFLSKVIPLEDGINVSFHIPGKLFPQKVMYVLALNQSTSELHLWI